VRSGGRDLERLLRGLLTLDLGEVDRVLGFAGEELREVDPDRKGPGGAVEERRGFVERIDSIHQRARARRRHGDRSFSGVDCRQDQASDPLPRGHDGHRQGAVDPADRAVEGELAHHERIREIAVDLREGSEQADGDAEVERRALLAHVRRREVDRDLFRGEFVTGVADGRQDAFAALLDGVVGKADHGEGGQAA